MPCNSCHGRGDSNTYDMSIIRDLERKIKELEKKLPCNMHNDSSPEDWNRGGAANEHNMEQLRRELIHVEAMLCAMCELVARRGIIVDDLDFDWAERGITGEDIEKWWDSHRDADKQRRKREKEHKAALAKLSDKEKRILGL